MARYQELVGVYHADGSLLGEARYVVGKILGRAHCSLCDITHDMVRKKKSFRDLECRLPLALRLLHLNERDEQLRRATEGRTPCVVGRTSEGWEMVLDAAALAACNKDVAAFESALRAVL